MRTARIDVFVFVVVAVVLLTTAILLGTNVMADLGHRAAPVIEGVVR